MKRGYDPRTDLAAARRQAIELPRRCSLRLCLLACRCQHKLTQLETALKCLLHPEHTAFLPSHYVAIVGTVYYRVILSTDFACAIAGRRCFPATQAAQRSHIKMYAGQLPDSACCTCTVICRTIAGKESPCCRRTSFLIEHLVANCRLVAVPGDGSIAVPLEDFVEQAVASQLDKAVYLPACTLETGGRGGAGGTSVLAHRSTPGNKGTDVLTKDCRPSVASQMYQGQHHAGIA